jgi:type II secretory pathway pseudopilin PulG
VIVIVLAIAAIVIPTILEGSRLPPHSRALSDMRSLATALEAYMVDTNTYPAMHPLRNYAGTKGSKSEKALRKAGGWDLYAIETGNALFGGLTTPVSYITSLPVDPFIRVSRKERAGIPIAYFNSNNHGFVLYSPGYDGVYDIDPAEDYDPAVMNPLPSLLQKTWDPTNGTNSRGDVWRIKQ